MSEYVSVLYKFQLEIEKRDLSKFLNTKIPYFDNYPSFELFKSNKREVKFPSGISDIDYYYLYITLDRIFNKSINPYEQDKDLVRITFFDDSELEVLQEFLNSLDFSISQFDFERFGSLKKFRKFAKILLKGEIDYWIEKLVVSKEKPIDNYKRSKGLDVQIPIDQKKHSDILLKSYEYERKSIKEQLEYFFGGYEDYHLFFSNLPYNYFIYEKELLECYLEVWESIEIEKESLENLMVFGKCINSLFNKGLLKYIQDSPKKVREWGPHDFESMGHREKSDFDNPFYNDQLDMDQQDPNFWDW